MRGQPLNSSVRCLLIMRIGRMKGPTWRDLIIPMGMVGGAIIGFLVAVISLKGSTPNLRSPGDPGDAAAMLGVFFTFGGAIIGTFIGIVVAIALYLKKRRQAKLR